ncbi:MAG: hypothetical protein O7E52_14015, partial [Candidatus Poribacteria bacterium]|nr:hypothetical protein [Candidatus Poribacteria bacterium]
MLQLGAYIAITLFIGKVSLIHADSGLPPFARDILEREGISIKELKNNRNLRKEWLRKLRARRGQETSEKQFQALQGGDFYGVIITNNLFHPLGYRGPKPLGSPFKLIGTIVYNEVSRSKALIQNNKNHQL